MFHQWISPVPVSLILLFVLMINCHSVSRFSVKSNVFNFKIETILQQAKAEQEEEFISNTLLKKIQALKKEKETLAHHYEQEEECLTNDLSRKLTQVNYDSKNYIYKNLSIYIAFL